MKHDEILQQLVARAKADPNTLGFLLFGSLATRSHRPDSDIDIITILQESKPTSGLNNSMVEGLKVGDVFFTYDVLEHSVANVPYLLHPLGEAKLLFDREGTVGLLLEKIRDYFSRQPEKAGAWQAYYRLNREEKAAYGYEKTTIVDVWNELEGRYSDGKTKRRFFNAFYFTNPRIFSLLKKIMHLTGM